MAGKKLCNMKKYFVRLGSKQYGPATIEELKKMNISRDTLVWFKGLSKWTPADQVPEIKDALFGASASSASFGQTSRATAQRRRTQTSIDDIVKSFETKEKPKGKFAVWVAILVIGGGMLFAYEKYKNDPNRTSTPVIPVAVDSSTSPVEEKIESKMERPQKNSEAAYPINYLIIKVKLDDYAENVTGTITNNASTVTYKDVTFTVFYENANGTTLDLEEFTVSTKVPPGETIKFKFKAGAPAGAKGAEAVFSEAKVD